MNIKHLILAAALASVSLGAAAQAPVASAPVAPPPAPAVDAAAETPSVLRNLRVAGVAIIKSFETPSGLTGWVLRDPSGNYNVVYTTTDGQYLVAGALLTAQGQNLTTQYQEAHIPKPDLSNLWPSIEKAGSLVAGAQGDAVKATVYVVYDPNCPFCDAEHKVLRHYWNEGLQVRYIPVAFLRPDSANKAAALMTAADTTVAFNEHSAKFRSGGIKQVEVTSDIQATLDANLALMRELGLNGTPALIYRDAKGVIHVEKGVSRSSKVAAMTGLPLQTLTDPDLAAYQ